MSRLQSVPFCDCPFGHESGDSGTIRDQNSSPKVKKTPGYRVLAAFLAAFLAVALAAGCGGGSSDGGGDDAARPTTPARLQILAPTPNETTGQNVTVKLDLIGAKVVPQTTGPLRTDEGHVHVSLDGQLVSMAYGTDQELPNLSPGKHSLQAEFVAVDHAPFANKVVRGVLFDVAAPSQ